MQDMGTLIICLDKDRNLLFYATNRYGIMYFLLVICRVANQKSFIHVLSDK